MESRDVAILARACILFTQLHTTLKRDHDAQDAAGQAQFGPYLEAARALSKIGSPLLRFWKVAANVGEDQDQTLYVLKIEKTVAGQKMRTFLNLLDENDILANYLSVNMRGDYAPQGRICRAMGELLQKHRPRRRGRNSKKKAEAVEPEI